MGTYVAMKQSLLSAVGLHNRLDLMGVRNLGEPVKFHSTVAISKQEFPAEDMVFPTDEFTAIIKEWTIFKSNNDDPDSSDCLVALLESDTLQKLHEQALHLGATHEYDGYNPHITVSYRYKQKLNLKALPVDYLVRFDPVPTIEPLMYY